MDKRDIKFNSFAVLLFDEIKPLMRAWERARQDNRFDEIQRIEGRIQDVFARRGYDLVHHATDFLDIYEFNLGLDHSYDWDRLFEEIPDLTEWPKQ